MKTRRIQQDGYTVKDNVKKKTTKITLQQENFINK